jgi:hypothetical protein
LSDAVRLIQYDKNLEEIFDVFRKSDVEL